MLKISRRLGYLGRQYETNKLTLLQLHRSVSAVLAQACDFVDEFIPCDPRLSSGPFSEIQDGRIDNNADGKTDNANGRNGNIADGRADNNADIGTDNNADCRANENASAYATGGQSASDERLGPPQPFRTSQPPASLPLKQSLQNGSDELKTQNAKVRIVKTDFVLATNPTGGPTSALDSKQKVDVAYNDNADYGADYTDDKKTDVFHARARPPEHSFSDCEDDWTRLAEQMDAQSYDQSDIENGLACSSDEGEWTQYAQKMDVGKYDVESDSLGSENEWTQYAAMVDDCA